MAARAARATSTPASSSTTSSLGQRSQVPVAGAASVIAVVDCGEGHLGDAHSIRHSTDMGRVTSVAAPGYVDEEAASNPSSIRVSARPISVAKFRSSRAINRVADGGGSHDCHSIQRPAVGSCHVVGAAMSPGVSSPINEWADRISVQGMVQLGPTFLLARSVRETATEGVMVPAAIGSQGISNMLDFADAFMTPRR